VDEDLVMRGADEEEPYGQQPRRDIPHADSGVVDIRASNS
jgi:hypothetical protein